MDNLFNNPLLQARNVPLRKRTGRLILIVDELAPGVFDIDCNSDIHAAKTAIIALNLFKQASAAVADEMERKEIMNQFDEVAGIVTGRKPSEAAPLFTHQGLKVCEHDYDPINGICLKCGRAK